MKVRWKAIFTLTFALTFYGVAGESSAARAAQSAPATVSVEQLRSDLLGVYLARARVHDLLGLLETAKWKMTDAERASFQQKTAAVDHDLQTLEKWRYQFFYHPQDAASGEKTLETMQDLVPELQEISRDAGHNQDAGTATQFQQAAAELSKLRDEIRDYLAAVFPGSLSPKTAATPVAARPTTSESGAKPASSAGPATAPNTATRVQPRPAPAETTSAPVGVPAVHFEPQQVQKLLLNVYLASARIKDLLSVVQPQEWKMAGGERTAFEQQLQSVQTGFANLEKWRYDFASHLQNTDSADQTVAAISTLLPQIQQIGVIVGQFEGQKAAAQFEQPQGELAGLENSIASYVASLRATYHAELAAAPRGSSGSLQTERIAVTAPPPPTPYLPGLTPPLTSSQVKAVLYEIYTSVYRIRDLLSQERPDEWKASLPERTAATHARASILSEASELEKWRGLFSEYPDNMYDAFQLYRSVQELVQPLQAFSLGVDRYENASLASDYSRRAGDLQARLGDLIPYINFFLQHESHNIDLYQSDLATCQNRLSYAMHGFIHPAIPMKNIVPDFKGRRVRRTKAKAAPHRRSRHPERKRRDSR
jgi:hypothetical protein